MELLSAPAPDPVSPHIGPSALSPWPLGLVVWGALIVFAFLLAHLFGEGKN